MAIRVAGVVAGKHVVTFDYTDKKTGKAMQGKRASIYVIDGGRPIEVAVHENFPGKAGDKVDLPVYVSTYVTKSGGAQYRLVHVRE
jgi:hypothetical protein